MRYLRQYAIDGEKDLSPVWAHIKAPTPMDAAVKGIDHSLLGCGTVYAYIAPDEPSNLHANGMPIFVRRYELKIDTDTGRK